MIRALAAYRLLSMNILAFDTCFDACSACTAVGEGGRVDVLASRIEHFATGHAEHLVPMISEVMRGGGFTFEDLDLIAVTVGPGTFTGTRIGIAAARGFALVSKAPLAGASSLAVMAEMAVGVLADDGGVPDFAGASIAVAVDARRGEVYVQLFGADGREELTPPGILPVADAARLGGSAPLIVAGSGAEALAAEAMRTGRRVLAVLPDLLPDACALARIVPRLAAEQGLLQPLYLRPPDAKPQAAKSLPRVEP
jgi:tRNA threonylcarbamoyladenosine biosynthesis protein TsaB